MDSQKISIAVLLSYALVIAPGCKKKTASSNVKDIPSSSWAEILPESDTEGRELMTRFSTVFRQNKIFKDLPFIAFNKETKVWKKATPDQYSGFIKLERDEELFVGTKNSHYALTMKPMTPRKNQVSNSIVRVQVTKIDLRTYKADKETPFDKGGGTILSFNLDGHSSEQSLQDTMSEELSKLQSLLSEVGVPKPNTFFDFVQDSFDKEDKHYNTRLNSFMRGLVYFSIFCVFLLMSALAWPNAWYAYQAYWNKALTRVPPIIICILFAAAALVSILLFFHEFLKSTFKDSYNPMMEKTLETLRSGLIAKRNVYQ